MDQHGESAGGVSADTSNRIFDFFKLPRELRDLIYDATLIEEKELYDRKDYRVLARRLPQDTLMLISRQFSQELAENVAKSSYLALYDKGHDDCQLSIAHLPNRARKLSTLELNLALDCDSEEVWEGKHSCVVRRALGFHEYELERLLPALPDITTVSVNLYLHPHSSVAICEAAILASGPGLIRMVAGSHHLQSANVYHCEYLRRDGRVKLTNRYSEERTLVMTYSHEESRFQRVHLEGIASGNGDTGGKGGNGATGDNEIQ